MTSNNIEKNNFKILVETAGIDESEDRLNIIDVFLDTEEHVTLEEFCKILHERGYDYEPEFVIQCLNRMVDMGFAQKKHFENQPIRYEHRHLGRHHDHLICTKCGKIIEFSNAQIENLQVKIASEHSFHMLQHRMEIYGLCDACFSERKSFTPLSIGKPGQKVIISTLTGERSGKARLSSLGLRAGDRVEIISNSGQGRIILAHKNSRIAVNLDIASRIMVLPADK